MSKITCQICNAQTHAIALHLKNDHADLNMSVADYAKQYPDAPLISEATRQKLLEKKKADAAAAAVVADANVEEKAEAQKAPAKKATTAAKADDDGAERVEKRPLHEVFGFTTAKEKKAAMSSKGTAIPVSVVVNCQTPELVPEVSDNYVFDADELKNVMLALELNINTYIWGHKGSGKSELVEQIAARTNRPLVRVQHTVGTEEAHIVGQWTAKDGSTHFELGLLPLAMKNGWTYLADEYDFAMPSVLSVYQAVLEGKALVIKEADHANRVIKPHPNFRFMATGNTNGSGDETGLYQGTSLQNSANYDRFGMVINKQYMDKKSESIILQRHVGLTPEDADKLVNFAGLVRDAYDSSKISDTVSPRTLINASKIGVMRGSYLAGIELSFSNKLSRVDKEAVNALAQRVFG